MHTRSPNRLFQLLAALTSAALLLSGLAGEVGLRALVPVHAAPPAAMTTSLTAYWTLDEGTNATRLDSVFHNDLIDHNGVVSATGVISQSAGFNGSTRYLSAANATELQVTPSGGWSMGMWV